MEGKNHVNQLAKNFGQEIENAGWIRYDRGIEFSILVFDFLAKKRKKRKKLKFLLHRSQEPIISVRSSLPLLLIASASRSGVRRS